MHNEQNTEDVAITYFADQLLVVVINIQRGEVAVEREWLRFDALIKEGVEPNPGPVRQARRTQRTNAWERHRNHERKAAERAKNSDVRSARQRALKNKQQLVQDGVEENPGPAHGVGKAPAAPYNKGMCRASFLKHRHPTVPCGYSKCPRLLLLRCESTTHAVGENGYPIACSHAWVWVGETRQPLCRYNTGPADTDFLGDHAPEQKQEKPAIPEKPTDTPSVSPMPENPPSGPQMPDSVQPPSAPSEVAPLTMVVWTGALPETAHNPCMEISLMSMREYMRRAMMPVRTRVLGQLRMLPFLEELAADHLRYGWRVTGYPSPYVTVAGPVVSHCSVPGGAKPAKTPAPVYHTVAQGHRLSAGPGMWERLKNTALSYIPSWFKKTEISAEYRTMKPCSLDQRPPFHATSSMARPSTAQAVKGEAPDRASKANTANSAQDPVAYTTCRSELHTSLVQWKLGVSLSVANFILGGVTKLIMPAYHMWAVQGIALASTAIMRYAPYLDTTEVVYSIPSWVTYLLATNSSPASIRENGKIQLARESTLNVPSRDFATYQDGSVRMALIACEQGFRPTPPLGWGSN